MALTMTIPTTTTTATTMTKSRTREGAMTLTRSAAMIKMVVKLMLTAKQANKQACKQTKKQASYTNKTKDTKKQHPLFASAAAARFASKQRKEQTTDKLTKTTNKK